LLYLSFYDVHIPLQAKKDLVAKYQEKANQQPKSERPRFVPEGEHQSRNVQDHPIYAAMIETLDINVGRVLDKLAELGLDENTVVIFTADNGGLSTAEGSPTSNAPLRVGKGWLYEGGIRVPWIMRWPGVTRPGTSTDVPVISTDFYPTILDIAGLPLRPQQHRDGISLVPLLRGTGQLPDRPLFWHYPHYSNQGGGPGGAVRQGELVLIEFYEDGRTELYNVVKDISQKHDLARAMPERVAELRRLLHQWRQEVDAKMPTPNPNWKGKTEE
jgi:arylsulfatase A-like enzyme